MWGGGGGGGGALKGSLGRGVPRRPSNPAPVEGKNCLFRCFVEDKRSHFMTLVRFVLRQGREKHILFSST